MSARSALSTLGLLTGMAGVVQSQGPVDATRAQRIDSVFAEWNHTDSPGCALGVMQNDALVYAKGYGMGSLEHGMPITPQTVFYIASTSKQFTAMSIALLAEEGKIALDDPVRKYIPELPAYADAVTIRHLVHHTSGIRDYLGLWQLSGRSSAVPILVPDGLDLITRQKALDFVPGSEWSYSNSGYFLLSQVVKRASGKSLRQYADEHIFQPLGMAHTHFHDDGGMVVPGRAEGYQRSAMGFETIRTSFALVGDGGLLTTIEDLVKWDANFYHNRLGTRGQALIDLVTTPGKYNDGRPLTYAFGLQPQKHRGVPIVTHGGSFLGFRAGFIRFPDQHFSVAALCNEYGINPDGYIFQVAEVFLGDKLAPKPTAAASAGAPSALDPAQLTHLVGRYEIAPGALLVITVKDGQLQGSAFGSPALALVPVGPNHFHITGLDADLTFVRSGDADATAATISFGGDPLKGDRLPSAPVLTAEVLASYAGDYYSEELDATYHLKVQAGNLVLSAGSEYSAPLQPLRTDTFGAQGRRLTFGRGKGNAVVRINLDAARSRNIQFVKK